MLKRYFLIFFYAVNSVCSEPWYTPTALAAPAHHIYLPKYIAHKGVVSDKYCGNTLSALLETLESSVDGIEIDIRLSKDGVLFLFHADRLEESTSGCGKPENFTWKQLQSFSYHDAASSKIAKLEDVLDLVGSSRVLFLDIKSDGILDNRLINAVVNIIKKHHLQETVIVESFNPIFLAAMRLKARDIILMYDFTINATAYGEEVQAQFDKIPWFLKKKLTQQEIRRVVRPDILGARFNLEPALIASLVKQGYPVISWTVDSPEIAQGLFKLGVRGVQTNKPLELLECDLQKNLMIYDAGLTCANIANVVYVTKLQDIIDTILYCTKHDKKITIAGRRHSMGGQTLLENAIQLDMMRFNDVLYDPVTELVTCQAGATWKKVQEVLDAHHRSIKVMQSDNIFTVGGSVSVNVHGWQVGCPPIGFTVKALTIVDCNGVVRTVSLENEPELFAACIGGYGLFGVIVSVTFQTVKNSSLKFKSHFTTPENFNDYFKKNISENPSVELAYARLSIDKSNLFNDMGLFWYERMDEDLTHKPMEHESLIAIKRSILRLGQYFEVGKKLRWNIEKTYAKKTTDSQASRNTVMDSDIHVIWQIDNTKQDLLHEYFVPKSQLANFLLAFKKIILEQNMNVLNVTIREVRKDSLSLLPYASEDMFALVCLFSCDKTDTAQESMKIFTQKLIDEVIGLGGRFYLPYKCDYTAKQLQDAYPMVRQWVQLKRKYDPKNLFNSQFFQYICSCLE